MKITTQQLQKLCPNNKNVGDFLPFIIKYCEKYEITTRNRFLAFISNMAEETGEFKLLIENLNYSEQGLLKTFPKYFNTTTAKQYARQPEKIANKIYCNRMGNGDEKSGDGWKFIGRGIIQITGQSNYKQMSEKMGLDLIKNPDLLIQPEYAVMSGCCWWHTNGVNKLADGGTENDFKAVVKKINGGYINLDTRLKYWNKAKEIFKEEDFK